MLDTLRYVAHETDVWLEVTTLVIPGLNDSDRRRARRLARANGLRSVYLGNVHDPTGGTTACPGCGATVLVRDGYQVVRSALDDGGRCLACRAAVPGRFDGPVGR